MRCSRTTISNQLISMEESFKQLDLLYEIYKLRRQKDLLSKRLNKVEKLTENNVNDNILAKLKALKIIADEINKNLKFVTTKLHKSYNFFQISHKIKELNQYMSNVNKALKKKQLDVNTYRLTKEYYQKDLKVHMEKLHKLKMIAKEYLIILKNEVLQIQTVEIFQKSNKLNILIKEIHRKKELTSFIEFLNEVILNNNQKS